MQSRVSGQAKVNAAASASVVGPVNVELFGFAKLTWNLQRCSAPSTSRFMRKFGEPAGGAVAPSRSDGRRLYSVVARLKQTAERLLGERRPPPGQEENVERELRETYDKPSDAIQARSGFRQ